MCGWTDSGSSMIFMTVLCKENSILLRLLQQIPSGHNLKSSYYTKAWKLKKFIVLINWCYTVTKTCCQKKLVLNVKNVHLNKSSQEHLALMCCENAFRNHKSCSNCYSQTNIIKSTQTNFPFAIITREDYRCIKIFLKRSFIKMLCEKTAVSHNTL